MVPVSKIKFKSPFPNLLEAVRFVSDLLDLTFPTHLKDQLDDKAVERYADPRLVDSILGDVLKGKLDGLLEQNEAAIFYTLIIRNFLEYLKWVSNIDVTGLSRTEVVELLYRYFTPPVILSFLTAMQKSLNGPSPLEVLRSDSAFRVMLDCICKTEPHWGEYWAILPKPKKDYFWKWKNADHLVTYESLRNIHEVEGPNHSFEINWSRVRALLVCGRAVDRFTQMTKRLEDKAANEQSSFAARSNMERFMLSVQDKQTIKLQQNQEIWPELSQIQVNLDLRRPVAVDDLRLLWSTLEQLEEKLQRTELYKSQLHYILWMKARWCVLSGELAEALKYYEEAFEASLYQAGHRQELLSKEALAVAASVMKINKVFVRKLILIRIQFEYDEMLYPRNSTSNRYEDAVTDAKIEHWRSQLNVLFPYRHGQAI